MRLHLALPVLLLVLVATPAHAAVVAEPAGFYAGGRALPAVDSDVRIEVHGPFADVVVTQTFRNDLERGIEAVYVFPLPADAAVSSMVIGTGDRTITASVARRADARAAYEEAVAQGVVAAMVEQERSNIFTQQVTGIEAGAEISVELRFDMAVGRWRDGWELALPLVVAPRHVPGAATGKGSTGTGTAPDTDEVGDASRVTPPARGDRGGNPIRVVIELGEVAADQVDVPSHGAEVVHEGGRTRITTRDARSDRDLVVRWTAPAAGAATALAERGDDGSVVAVVVETPRASTKRRQRRKWLLVLDVSGSMDGDALLLLRDAAHAVIDRVGGDQVAVLGPSGGSLKWRRGERGLAMARATVDGTDASGGTALGELLGSAVAAAAGDEAVAVVVISDGLVADDVAVASRLDGTAARIHAIGVGSAPNRWLLEELARRGRGTVTVLGTGDDIGAAVTELVASAGAPVITPTIDWGGLPVRDGTPSTLPALAAGRAIVVAARVERLTDAQIVVRLGKRRFEATIDGDVAVGGRVLARRWARARIDDLVRTGGSGDEITALGLAHSLVTPNTALVARGERVTVEGGVRTTVAVPVAMPAGMRWQSVFGPDGDTGSNVYPTVTESDSTDVAGADPTGSASGDGDGVDDEQIDERSATAPVPMEPGAMSRDGGSYNEVMTVSGAVIMQRRWTGSVSLSAGLHTRADERSAAVGLSAGAYRAVSRHWKLGLSAELQLAPGVEGGTDAAAYLTARRYVDIAATPVLAIDLGIGPSLDVAGVAWRFGLRLGPWAFAPVIGVDQTRIPDDDGGWSTRTTIDIGLEWSF